MEMLERGFKFRQQPLLFMITNSGSDRNSVAWEEHEHAVKVAAGNREAKDDDATYLGEPIDDTTFSYVCGLDKGDTPLTNPKCWPKANPLLGVTILEDYLAGVVKQAKDMPGKMNGILRLHFCVWTEAETAWMTREILEPCLADFDPVEHHGKTAYDGIDLSQNRDLTVKATVVKTGEVELECERDGNIQTVTKPKFDAWIEAWTPGDTAFARSLRDKQPYPQWIKEGFLSAPHGQSIRFDHVAQAVAEDAHNFDLQAVAYDRYAFKRGFEPECDKLGISVEFVEHPQGGTKKGKPTEAMKDAAEAADREPEGLWMPGSIRELEDALLEGRIRLRRNPVLISAMMSAVTDEDRWGNYWLAKERAVNKIDAAIALAMAVGAAMAHEGSSNAADALLASLSE
jgi:phage terminase large subunit-like protein